MSLTELETVWGEDAAAVASDWLAQRRLSVPCSGKSPSTSSVLLPLAIRSDSGEAVWLLTEKAREYFSHSPALLYQKASLGQPCLGRGTERCAGGGRTSP